LSLAIVPDQSTAMAECEYALLAKLLFDPKVIDTVADILREEHFSQPFFGRCYGLIVTQHARGQSLNALTLRSYIENDPGFEQVGGNKFIAGFANTLSGMVPAKSTALQIRDMAKRRELLAGLSESIAIGSDINETIETIIDAAETALVNATSTGDAISQPSAADAMLALMRAAEQPKRSIRCKIIPSMDDLLGGMRPKQLIIGGGRPGMGKTAAALSYSLGAAQSGYGVLFISLEMGATELAARMAADLSFNGHHGVAYADINSDNPSQRAIRAMGDAEKMLRDIPLHIIDAGSLTLGRLELLIRRYKRRFAAKGHSLDLVVVDYLQLLRTDDRQKSAYEAVSEISRRLKGMAKDQEVAVFALAQLSREVEKRADKKPILSDLRESGQIEQDADAVIFFYRLAYYVTHDHSIPEAEKTAALRDCEHAIDFICAKRRNGVTGSAVGEFYGQYQAVRG
jgi:replicative DNA helicase